MVRFDAYTATMKGPKPDDLMQILFDQVGTAAGFSKTRGFHTFGERLAIKDGSGHEFGAIQWGGRQEDRLMFEVKGEHSQKAAEALRARFEHRVTRGMPAPISTLLGPLKPSWRHPSRSRRSAASWAAKLAIGTTSRRRAGLCTWAARAAPFVCVSTKRGSSLNTLI